MADLYPTKTRLALLRLADNEKIIGYPPYNPAYPDEFYERGGGRLQARVVEAMDAGWLERGPVIPEMVTAYLVVLTEAGRKVLEEADGG